MSRDGRDPHGEHGLVGVLDGRGDRELGAGVAQVGAVLSCDEHGDRQDVGRLDHLLRRDNTAWVWIPSATYAGGGFSLTAHVHFIISPDCRAKLLLDIANAI